MPYTAPTTRAAEFKVTAAVWNTDIVENIKYLKDAPVFDGDVSVAATKKLFLDGGGNTYVQEVSADTIVAFTNGIERLRIGSTGRVGIGTTSPDFLLDVAQSTNGTVATFGIEGQTINPRLRIEANESTNTVGFNPNYSGATSPALVFKTQESERLRITSGGDLAIGATAKLYLDGTAATGNTYLQEVSADTIVAFTNGSERLRIDNRGNVGLNVSAFGTSAANVFAIKNGTEPTTGPADTVQIYSVDRSAGNTIPAIYCEGTGVTDAGITSTTVTHKIAMKVNGTVYYLLATTSAS